MAKKIAAVVLAVILILGLTACSSKKGGKRYIAEAQAVLDMREAGKTYTHEGVTFTLGDDMSETELIAYSMAYKAGGNTDIISSVPLYGSSGVVAYAVNFADGYAVVTVGTYSNIFYSPTGKIEVSEGEFLVFFPPCGIYSIDDIGVMTDIFTGHSVDSSWAAFEMPYFKEETDEFFRTYSVLNAMNRLEGKEDVFPRL